MDQPAMKDSGERRTFSTGAVRDRGDFKPRPDLISPHANLREGAWLAKGAEKYDVDNWAKGMPIRDCIASLTRHLEDYKLGLQDEDHMAAIRTNAGFILHFEEEIKAGRLPKDLDDMPHYISPKETRLAELQRRVDNGEMLSDREEDERHRSVVVGGVDPAKPGSERTIVQVHKVPLQKQLIDDLTGDIVELSDKELDRLYKGPVATPPQPFTVYLCGPITGEAIDHQWRDTATVYFANAGIRTLDPLRGKARAKISNQGMGYDGQLASTEMAERDRLDIEEADLIFAHFPYEPPRQSIGSLMEMGAAAIGLGKPVVLCTSVQAFQDHLFCRRFCINVPNFEAALYEIRDLAECMKENAAKVGSN